MNRDEMVHEIIETLVRLPALHEGPLAEDDEDLRETLARIFRPKHELVVAEYLRILRGQAALYPVWAALEDEAAAIRAELAELRRRPAIVSDGDAAAVVARLADINARIAAMQPRIDVVAAAQGSLREANGLLMEYERALAHGAIQ